MNLSNGFSLARSRLKALAHSARRHRAGLRTTRAADTVLGDLVASARDGKLVDQCASPQLAKLHAAKVNYTMVRGVATLCFWAFVLSLPSPAATSSPLLQNSASGYLGNQACQGCHEAESADWQDSHHDLAMQEATAETVLGDFNNATFQYGDVTTRFFQKDNQFWVETDNEEGQLAVFPVAYVFGVDPLQQLLLPLSDGRLQALGVAWDARPKADGGQRWYHLYPDEIITAGDPLHWTGPYANWNTRCAECHSTDVKKNYDAATRSYATTYAQIDVGCEACHGPGKDHVALASQNQLASAKHAGFAMSLAARGQWLRAADEPIAHRSELLADNIQIDNCARCHARRGTLGDYHYGADLLDTHRLSLLETPLYWPDGQIRDEVYVYGSFVQSKMHQAGVVCSNCHNPHSNALYAEGNGVCAQCHKPERYDVSEHHRHSTGSEGAQCVNCHMPAQLYMGVDWRHDHSMRVPRPELSLTTGSPNACTQCHQDKTDSWALDALNEWGVTSSSAGSKIGRSFHSADRGDVRALPSLKSIIEDPSVPAIQRGSALLRYGTLSAPDLPQTAAMALGSEDPLIRVAAVQSLSNLPARQRYMMLRTLINDPVLAVRIAVAQRLADAPLNELRPKDIAALEPLFDSYLSVQQAHADMPSVQMQLSNFWRDRGDIVQAEAALREALRINPQLQSGIINLSDILRATGREAEGRTLLSNGIAQSSAPSALHHALGLLEIRAGNMDAALSHLKMAAALETESSRHRYVYAIALHDTGDAQGAITLLEKLNTTQPGNPEVLFALIGYCQEVGDASRAGRYQAQLQSIAQAAGLQ